MSAEIVRSGPVAVTARGPQAPPSIADRVARSSLIVSGVLRVRPGQRRRFAVGEVMKGNPSSVADLEAVVLPPFPPGDHTIAVMVARDGGGDLRLTGDPRQLDLEAITATLRAD